jgi:hypothetical protein
LAELETAGLLEATNAEPPEYAYRPRTEELVTAVERLALIYRERRVAVTTLIYSDSTYAMRSFANAFRLWKDHES